MRTGRRLRSLLDIRDAALKRQSLVCPLLPTWSKPRPAAFILNVSGGGILRMLTSGLYVYRRA